MSPDCGGHRLDRWREAWYLIYIHFHMKYKENLFAKYEYQSKSGPSGLRLELPAGAVRRDIEQRSLYPSEEPFKVHHIFRQHFLRNQQDHTMKYILFEKIENSFETEFKFPIFFQNCVFIEKESCRYKYRYEVSVPSFSHGLRKIS